MSKTQVNLQPLSIVEIVMRANADVIRNALAKREEVDGVLAEREEAYKRIAELEKQVDDILGVSGVFEFPAPGVSVSGMAKAAAGSSKGNKPVAKNPPVKKDMPAEAKDVKKETPATGDGE